MNRSRTLSLLPVFVLAVVYLAGCSGLPNGCLVTTGCPSGGGGGGGTGTANVVVTVTSTPSQTFLFPYLEWVIQSVDLIDSSGGDTNVIAGAPPPIELARLQTDSQFLGIGRSIPDKTYSKVKIQFKPSTATSFFFNSSGATLFGCAAGAVCPIPSTPGTVAGFAATTVTVPVSFKVTGNTGFSLNFDLSKAVTSAGGMTFDFTQAGAITLATLPRVGQVSGSLDLLENFTGEISAKGTTTIDMFSLSSDTRTITVPTIAEFDDPFNVCKGAANFSCLALNQNVSVDAVINSTDGTLIAYEVDFLDPGPGVVQETEGIIVTPVSGGQFQMVVTNGMPVSGILPGTLSTITLNNASSYFVDPKSLGVSTTPVGFQSSSDLVMGQTVMLQGGTISATNGLSGYTRTLLRYSSIGGTAQAPGTNIFTLIGLSPFFTSSTTNTVQVMVFPLTTYDNITGINGLVSGTTNASVRGLYLNPNSGATSPLLAAKVRAHL